MNCKPVIALCSLFYNTRSVVCKRLEDGSDLSKETYEMCESGQAQRVCERLTLLEAQIKELEQAITVKQGITGTGAVKQRKTKKFRFSA